jgi:hypothetical protein
MSKNIQRVNLFIVNDKLSLMERVGEILPNFPRDVVRTVIQLLTLDAWHRLDRDVSFFQLGIGIGRVIEKVDSETLKIIVDSCEYYQSLCKGIAKGMEGNEVNKDLLIYLGNLSPIMAREILANLDLSKYPEVIKALANNVSSLKHLPNVGSNIARQIDKIPFEIRRQIINILKENTMFLYEFLQTINLSKIDDIEQFIGKNKEIDEIIGYKLNEVNDKMKEKLLSFPSIAIGVGKGFQNLSYYWKRRVIDKVMQDKQFAKGFLSSIDFTFLEDEFVHKLIEIGMSDEELARVLGRNLGDSFPSLAEDLKTLAINMAEKNNSFAYGLGEGISESVGSFVGFIRGKVYELKKEDQERILNLAFQSEQFAKGLFSNFNALFFFENRNKILSLVMKYSEYLPIFIEQISRRINDFDLSKLLSLKGKVAYELGRILCRSFIYLSKENRELVLNWLDKNIELKEGFLQC